MSAWGISNFENDTALGWVADVVEKKSFSDFKLITHQFVEDFDPESTSLIECSKFLATAETIAGSVGSASEDFPEELKDWIETKYIKIEQSTINKAIEGVELILKDSEAKEMFLDSGYFDTWAKNQKDLIKRLSE